MFARPRRPRPARHTREKIVGWGTFGVVLAGCLLVGAATGSPTLRGFSLIAGLGGGGAMGVLAALMAHLTRPGDARYSPIEGDGGAWGMMEYEERTKLR